MNYMVGELYFQVITTNNCKYM